MRAVREIVVIRREPLHEKHCPVCGRSFLGLSRRRYCTTGCSWRAAYLRSADYRRARRREQSRQGKRETTE